MARDFSKVSPSLWQSSRFHNLASDDVRYLYLYLLTSQHQNSAGAFWLPRGYAQVDLRWDEERFLNAQADLEAADMIEHDPATEEYRICRWFKHNPPMNNKHRIGIINILERLESETLCENVIEELEAMINNSAQVPAQSNVASGSYGGDLASTPFMSRGRQ